MFPTPPCPCIYNGLKKPHWEPLFNHMTCYMQSKRPILPWTGEQAWSLPDNIRALSLIPLCVSLFSVFCKEKMQSFWKFCYILSIPWFVDRFPHTVCLGKISVILPFWLWAIKYHHLTIQCNPWPEPCGSYSQRADNALWSCCQLE